jgi:hypothetical protein
VDFEEWLAFKIQLHGTERIVSLKADSDQSKKRSIHLDQNRKLNCEKLT